VIEHNTRSNILQLKVCNKERWYKCTRQSFEDTVQCEEIKTKKK